MKTTKATKKIDATKGLKQTINGREAIVHKLPANHPLMLATNKGYATRARFTALREAHEKIDRDMKRLMLEIAGIKEDQQEAMQDTFNTSTLPTKPLVMAEVLENAKGQADGIAFYLTEDKARNQKINQMREAIEDLLEL